MRILSIIFCLIAAPITAQEHRTEKIIQAYEAWMQERGITEGSIAVIEDGRPPRTKGYGRKADAPVTLASLSKAITGACVAVLQQEGVFDLDTPISDLLDVPEGSGSLPEYLTQISGFHHDPTQGKPWHLETDRSPRHMLAAELTLNSKRAERVFSYNNGNFAIAGAVIDAVAQQDYATDCKSLVLDPLGITTAALDPVWGPLAAWGGWSMSVGDYALFAKEWFGSERSIGRDPLAWPNVSLGRGAYYLMGTFFREMRGRKLFWHAGLLCWNGDGDGSYFASYDGDVIVVVSYATCLPEGRLAELDQLLFRAAVR